MRYEIRQNTEKSREKALRLPEDHQRSRIFGLKKSICKELGEHHRAPFELFTIKPWEKGLEKFIFSLL